MTKKDFILITNVIKDTTMDESVKKELTLNFAYELQKENIRFDIIKFVKACGVS